MDRFQILCLSGGGFRGLYTAGVLAQLEEAMGKPINECFDLICGTSIGGIIATGLAFGVPASKIHKTLLDEGSSIFTKRNAGWLKPQYDNSLLKAAIEGLLPEDARMKHAKVPYLLTAINLHTGKPRVFKTPHYSGVAIDGNLFACDTAMATSAAPTLFSPIEIDGESFVDGGLFANSPYLIGLHEAENFLNVPINKIHMLCIGTTNSTVGFGYKPRSWGKIKWLWKKFLLEVSFSAQEVFAANMVLHRLGEDRFIQINENHADNRGFVSAMDDASSHAKKQLQAMSRRSSMSAVNNQQVKDFFEHDPNRNGLNYNFLEQNEVA